MGRIRRILSVQSHVVYGYVGNRSSVFPLQLLGYDVDCINSVQLSNHTQYDHCSGQVLSLEDLDTIYDSLKKNGINNYDCLITGYVGDVKFLQRLGEIITDIKKSNPSARYYCDPVIGDNDKIYVPEALIPVYKNTILPLADFLMPNQFEAELLTGCKITDEQSALNCIDTMHNAHGIPCVIFSSTELHNEDSRGKLLTSYVSFRPDLAAKRRRETKDGDYKHSGNNVAKRVRITFPLLPATFFGTGDLFSALTLAYSEMNYAHIDLKKIFHKVQSTMHAVLTRTCRYAEQMNADPENILPVSARYELKLIQSAKDIINPPETDRIEVIDL